MGTKKTPTKKQPKRAVKKQRDDFHHLGSPTFCESFYHKDNCEYTLVFRSNGTTQHFLKDIKDLQNEDYLLLGISEDDVEFLLNDLLQSVTDRLKDKVELYNEMKKTYWMKELDGNEDEWKDSNWNSLKQ